MASKGKYRYLQKRADKRAQELFIHGTGIRASTIWHDRYVSRISPEQIAKDHDLPVNAVYEALAYCQENWDKICKEKDLELERLRQKGFFEERFSERP